MFLLICDLEVLDKYEKKIYFDKIKEVDRSIGRIGRLNYRVKIIHSKFLLDVVDGLLAEYSLGPDYATLKYVAE